MALSPVSYATAQMAALFIKYFPRESAGVFPPGAIPLENRQAILKDLRSRGIRVAMKVTRTKLSEDDEEFYLAFRSAGVSPSFFNDPYLQKRDEGATKASIALLRNVPRRLPEP